MTTKWQRTIPTQNQVVEAYRLDRYDNIPFGLRRFPVFRGRSNVEAYRLDRYDNYGRIEVLYGLKRGAVGLLLTVQSILNEYNPL